MTLACIRCEGGGVVRHYLNVAGDFRRYHCPDCGGTGKQDYSEPLTEERCRSQWTMEYEERVAKQRAKSAADRAELKRKLLAWLRSFNRG